jgi:hypothetical protein
MKTLLLGLLLGAALGAQTIGFYIDSSSGGLPVSQLTPLPSTYQFPDTPVGAGASVVIRVVNLSTSDVTIDAIFIGASPASSVATPNFTITGWQTGGAKIAPQGFKLFTLNFTPASAGVASGYLQAQVDENPTPLAVATVRIWLPDHFHFYESILRCSHDTDRIAPECKSNQRIQPQYIRAPVQHRSKFYGIFYRDVRAPSQRIAQLSGFAHRRFKLKCLSLDGHCRYSCGSGEMHRQDRCRMPDVRKHNPARTRSEYVDTNVPGHKLKSARHLVRGYKPSNTAFDRGIRFHYNRAYARRIEYHLPRIARPSGTVGHDPSRLDIELSGDV